MTDSIATGCLSEDEARAIVNRIARAGGFEMPYLHEITSAEDVERWLQEWEKPLTVRITYHGPEATR